MKSNQAIANTDDGAQYKFLANRMNGHFSPNFVTNEVWGLTLYEEGTYLTCSDDGTMRMWDIEKKEQLAVVDLKFDAKLKPIVQKAGEKFLHDSVKGRCLAVSE